MFSSISINGEAIERLSKYKDKYTYVLRFYPFNIFKIGYTKNLKSRMSSLCGGDGKTLLQIIKKQFSPKEKLSISIFCLLKSEAPEVIEKYLHYKFKDKVCWRKEFFTLSEEDLAFIESLGGVEEIKIDLIKNIYD